MTKRRLAIALFAVVGAFIGAVFGVLMTPNTVRYGAWADVVLVPPPELSSAEASSFWEVLTGGQISRTAAIIYGDARWLPPAAAAAGVPQRALDVEAYALPETTMLVVTAQADSQAAADSALDSVLTTATPEVSSVLSPYFVKVLWPRQDDPITGPGKKQFAAAGALGGLLVCGGLGWLLVRRRFGPAAGDNTSSELLDEGPPSR